MWCSARYISYVGLLPCVIWKRYTICRTARSSFTCLRVICFFVLLPFNWHAGVAIRFIQRMSRIRHWTLPRRCKHHSMCDVYIWCRYTDTTALQYPAPQRNYRPNNSSPAHKYSPLVLSWVFYTESYILSHTFHQNFVIVRTVH